MNNRSKVIVGSLVGGLAIHAAFLACGGGGSSAGSTDGGITGMLDAISMLMDGTTKDAKADTDGGTGSCGCTGQVQSVPASENPAQLLSGTWIQPMAGGSTILAQGPFVLTDANPGETQANLANYALVVQASGASCPALPTGVYNEGQVAPGYIAAIGYGSFIREFHGGRYVVPSGKMLCAYAFGYPVSLVWSGFKPY